MALINDWQQTQKIIRDNLIKPPLDTDGIDYSCIWGYQTGDRLTKPVHVMLHLRDIKSITPYPEIQKRYVPGNPNGQQIELSSRDHTEFMLQIDVFSNQNEALGLSAKLVAQRIKTWINLESVAEELDTKSVVVVDVGFVQSIPAVLESKYESRARLDVRFRVVDGALLKTTWIETVDGPTGTLT